MQRCDSRNDEIITEKRVKKAAVAQVCDLYKDTDGGKEKFRALKRKNDWFPDRRECQVASRIYAMVRLTPEPLRVL